MEKRRCPGAPIQGCRCMNIAWASCSYKNSHKRQTSALKSNHIIFSLPSRLLQNLAKCFAGEPKVIDDGP